jgi:hypothetical protein
MTIKVKAKLKQKIVGGEKIILKEEGIIGLKKIDDYLKNKK